MGFGMSVSRAELAGIRAGFAEFTRVAMPSHRREMHSRDRFGDEDESGTAQEEHDRAETPQVGAVLRG
ncbi:hypothetical protein IU470_13725 [Nocardia abscessus]|uniref:Uncharacterized protein n=1 Tax=Nocardia abscessus TaxID=120957 RepID=A0ABS0CCM1_9NOCA|nr:hypothetical protein [Nocardia abscessus]MBF6226153.1 hypothetical protein [Nocardia abscessus]